MTPRPPIGRLYGLALGQLRSRVYMRDPVIHAKISDASRLGLGPDERTARSVDYALAQQYAYYLHRPDEPAKHVEVPDAAYPATRLVDAILTMPPLTEADRIKKFLGVIGV